MDVKKILAVATAVVGTVAMADIVSSSVVGYQTRSMIDDGDQLMESYSGGPVFKAVGSTGNTYTLNDFTVNGMDCSADCIQFLDPDTTDPYLYATYADADSYAAGWVGWWDYDDLGGTRLDGEEADEFASGTAFLALYASGNEINFTFSGEVEAGTKEIVTTTESPFICNPQPVDFTLANVKCEGMDVSADAFQYLDPFTTEEYLLVTYANEADYGAGWAGWWDYDDLGSTRTDDEDLPAGQGLLGMIASGNEVTLTFDAVFPANN